MMQFFENGLKWIRSRILEKPYDQSIHRQWDYCRQCVYTGRCRVCIDIPDRAVFSLCPWCGVHRRGVFYFFIQSLAGLAADHRRSRIHRPMRPARCFD